jgi:murein DD-endopeptidase MepM/ murein hydrolase activator NlpD
MIFARHIKARFFLFFILVISLVPACNQNHDNLQTWEPSFEEQKPLPELVKSEGIIQVGQTLEQILTPYNLARREIYDIARAFAQIFDVRHIRPGKTYIVYTDSVGEFQKFEYIDNQELCITVERDSTNEFLAQRIQIPLITKIESLKGSVSTTLYDAIIELHESPELIVLFSDIFQWDIDFFIDPRHGDEFRIVYEKCYLLNPDRPDSLGEFVRYGRILAGQYFLKGEPLTAIYFDNAPGQSGYYDLDGKSFQKTFLKSPLNYRRISSYFSGARRHPIFKKIRPHYAVDYAAPIGTPVSAAADGVVIEKGYNSGLGNYLKIRHHNQRYTTLYGHLSRFANGITEGVKVRQKDIIAYVGKTGNATGPHLHYAFYDRNIPINPLKIKNTSGDPILPQNWQSFNVVKENMLTLLDRIDYYYANSPYSHIKPSHLGIGPVGLSER